MLRSLEFFNSSTNGIGIPALKDNTKIDTNLDVDVGSNKKTKNYEKLNSHLAWGILCETRELEKTIDIDIPT